MRPLTAIFLFLPLLGLAMGMVYMGIVVGKMFVVLSTALVAAGLELPPIDRDVFEIISPVIPIIVVLFGILFAHLSAIGVTGEPRSTRVIVKGVWTCLLAGMTVGITGLLPATRIGNITSLNQFFLSLRADEAPILLIGLGIMLYYFFAALRRGS